MTANGLFLGMGIPFVGALIRYIEPPVTAGVVTCAYLCSRVLSEPAVACAIGALRCHRQAPCRLPSPACRAQAREREPGPQAR